ncbi:hypothetical protein Vafri_15365 [Volvox africanus]|uniref:GTP diphosphokinase n=1 Tax=Volvox africanus TaxID=51714 RepID=A0A8J4BG30_9CHLO|nr:hypothetical protein Vafri_15365 [Volvox africanus]
MVHTLEHKETVGSNRRSRWSRCSQNAWLRRASFPRRQPTSRAAPHAHLSLASGVPLVVGWSHTVTSGAHHGASLWFTTLCALSVALGALSYNLMAVLGEFFNFDRRAQQVQPRTYLHGVDVTNSRFFQHTSVLAAVGFAAEAHAHQRRKTGEPYVTHCIETALIVEACLPPAHSAAEQERHISCIMAAVLHDVIDDTPTDLSAMQQAFGHRVAGLVNQVSKLSQMNQLLRRGKRQGWAQYSPDHFKQLRKLIVDLAFEEPLVILVKLADRLHNMRTVYVLAPEKQRSVAEETLEVWCSMAESLGWDGLKSEMEDLCFAVLQPSTYCTLRAELDRLWSLPTLAVVEEQLGGDATAPGQGPGGGGGRDELGLRIVQVSGPEAPVRHYTRAAGVRAAAAAASSSSDSGGSVSRFGNARVRRRQRQVGRSPLVTEGSEPATAAVLERAAQAAMAAAAVPLPPPSAPVAPALVVAAVASSSTVAVLEVDPLGDDRVKGSTGTSTSAAMSAVAVAVEVAVEDSNPSFSTSLGLSRELADDGSGAAGDDASSSSAQLFVASGTAAVVVAPAPSSYNFPHTGSSGDVSFPPAAPASGGWTWSASSEQHSASGAPAARDESSSDGEGSSGRGFRLGAGGVSRDGGAGLAEGLGVMPSTASETTFTLSSYGTLESVDGPLLLDNIDLPFGLTAPAVATADGSSSSGDSTSRNLEPRASSSASSFPPEAATTSAASSLPSPSSQPMFGGPTQQSQVHSSNQRWQLQLPQQGTVAASAVSKASTVTADVNAAAPDDAVAATVSTALSDLPPPPPLPLSPLSPQQERLKLILSTVVPFESVGFKSLRGLASSTRRGLEVLDECAALLYNEIQIRSQAGGLGINIQGRLKSLNSVYRKMVRKNVAVAQVYDSRALRVIVDDAEGNSLQEAVEVCYRLVGAVHSIWKPIKREFDDYIANPKQSGYQALHTAVRGPGGIPMEVQIKTSSMHELAEYGAAAHWVYKEYTPVLQNPGRGPGRGRGPSQTGPALEKLPEGYLGQPVLKVSKDKLRYGVVVSRQDEGQRLIVAVKLGSTFRPFPTRLPEYGFYADLLSYTRTKGWQVPGHGDLVLRLEEFVKCDDGRYHRRDHLGYLIPAETITLLEGFEEDAVAATEAKQAEEEAAAAAAAAAAASEEAIAAAAAIDSAEDAGAAASASSGAGGDALRNSADDELLAAESSSVEQRRLREQMRVMFVKTQQLRSMIAWGEGAIGKYAAADYQSDEVSVLIWPGGRIEHFARGTTAGNIVAEKGLITTGEGYDGYRVNLLINVNNRLVPEDTVLNDGDLVILAREKVRI